MAVVCSLAMRLIDMLSRNGWLSMCTRSGEWTCPFCSHTRPVVDHFRLRDCICTRMGRQIIWGACHAGLTKSWAWSASRSREVSNLVIARLAGFSLCTTPNFQIRGEREPGKQEGQRAGFASTKDSCCRESRAP